MENNKLVWDLIKNPLTLEQLDKMECHLNQEELYSFKKLEMDVFSCYEFKFTNLEQQCLVEKFFKLGYLAAHTINRQ